MEWRDEMINLTMIVIEILAQINLKLEGIR